MRRDIKRAVLGALTLATVAACSDGASPEAEQKTAKQGLLDGPDFVVTVLSAPPSALPGSSFMTSLRVCNHGTWAGGTEVALVLSQDSDISLSMDGQAGSIYAGYLAPGACETHSTLLYTPPQGTWFLGAIADPYGSEPELDEGNNTRLGGPITIGYGPDFVVTGVKAPASSLPGGNLTADVTVCNQGTEPDGTAVALYLSADALPPQPEQPVAAWAAVGFIFPGQCTTVPAYGNAILPPPGTEGAYHLGARVDPDNHRLELREDNNTHVGAVMGVGHRADFVVTNVQAPASLLPGQSFTAQVTVCNQGTQPDSADVALVLSADAIIDPGTGPEPTEDVLLGQRPAGDLFPGQCVTLPMFVNATPPPPGTEGAYRLGAVVDPLNQRAEFLEGNNTHADFVVGVGYRADFVVKAVKGPAALRPGQDFVARVTVCNQGNTPDSADVALVLSDDALIQPSTAPGAPGDVIVGWVPVSTLGPNQCATVPMTGNSPSLQGLYHLGAFVDVLNQRPELRDDNNTHPGYRLGVGNGADFTVQTVTGPGGVEPGQLLTAQVKVCNQGTDAGMAEVMLLLSSDATVQWGGGPWGDLVIGVAPVGLLFPGHCVTVPVSGNASLPYPGHEGAYHLGAAALASQGTDLNPENDLHSGYRLGVGHRPDFTVTDVKAPPSVESGQGFLAQATVCNQGTQPEATEVRLFLSDVAPIVANPGPWQGGVSVGAANLLPLMPGQCVTVQVPATWSQPYTLPEGAYHLVAVVDPGNHRAELIEDNNAHADFVLGVGHRADFIVKAVQAPASVQPGQSLTAQVTVCNQGTLSDSADVALFLASEPFSRPAPGEEMLVTYLGQAPVGFLAPGRCATVPMTGTATLPPPGSPGAYYLGALVDFSNQRPELIEDNNAHPGAVLGVGSEPDFVVTDVKGPSSVEVGQPLTAQVTVCNQGTQPDDVQVALVLSTDDVIRPEGPGPVPGEDRPVGGASVGHLLPGQCATVPVSGNAYPPPPGDEGAYFLGAFVDPGYQRFELREDNNAHAGHMLGVGHGPDFVVTDVKGPPSTQTPHPFTAQVTVCNQGTQPGDAALALVLSADSVIRPQKAPGVGEDPVVGGALTGPLYPGRCATVPVSGNASVPSPGTGSAFHLGAFVDPEDQRPELIEDNNTHPGYVLGVGNGADFIVTAVKGPASVQSGQPFTAQVTVCNQGTLPDTTDVVLFLSRDGALPPASGPGGSPIGGAPVNFTLPGQCLTVPVSTSVSVPASGPEGAYHLGAVVDPGNQRTELLETNNSHPGYVLGVGYRADFIVSDVKAPASVQPGQPLTAQVTVCNQGTRPDSTQVVLMLSADATLVPPTVPGSTADTVVGSASVGLLSPGQCATVPVTGPANPPSPGAGSAYFLGAFVDPGYQRVELREDNNAHASAMLGVGNRPDFVVTHVKGPVNVQTGQPLTAQVTVCNQGTQPEMAEVQLLLSADALLRPPTGNGPEEDAPVAFTAVGPLYPGQCAPVSMSGSANLPSPGLEGTYHLGAFVDPLNQRPELREDNNTHTLTRVGVGNGPDFVVTQVTGPPSALPGQPITAQVTVCNQGTEFETAEVAVLLSHDTLLRTDTGEDLIVGSTNVGPLYPGQCTTAPVTGPASPPGPAPGPSGFVLGAVVDPFNLRAELVEDNNTHTGFRMGIGNAPDFVVSAVTGVPSALPGQSFTANVTVCNNGQLGQMADVKVILSADAIIRVPSPSQPTEDFLLGTVSGVGLSPGKCVTRPLSVTVPSVPEGGYYLGAVVDPANVRAELIEDNNTLAVTRLGVGRLPDFVISSVTGSTSIKPGAPINTTTVICNRGQAGGTVDAELFLLTSPTVTLPPVSSEAFFLGRFSGLSLGAGQCVTRSLTVPAPAGLPEGTYHLGAVADLINARMELIEDNNVLAGSRIGVGFQPDFVVTAVSAPASVVRGAALTVSTTVCNQGSNVGSAEVDLFFSADTTVRAPSPYQPPEDFFLGTFAVTGLGVGQCITRPLTVSANAPTGLYYVGAVADPRSTTLEFFEDNNALAGTRVNVMP